MVKEKVTVPDYFYNVIIPQMPSYYSDYTVDFEGKPVVKCPIHGEDTPSLRYYEETNTFYCFGCRAGGDVINLHRLYSQVATGTMPDFDQAVMFLYKFFIQGKESENFNVIPDGGKTGGKLSKPTTLGKTGPKLVGNTNADKVKFGQFIKGIEDTLMIDKTIAEAKKKQMYSLIDNTELLISLDVLRVNDAIEAIKQEIRNRA